MDLSELQALHCPCEGKNPSGANLEYDDRFLEMMRMGERHPEVQYGSTILPARSPDWKRLLDCGLAVAQSTRDLRVGVLIVEGLCRTHEWSGLANGLELLAHWVRNYWDTLHPQLEEEDGFDPTNRLSILSQLVVHEHLLQGVLQIPLSEHRYLGKVTLRDYNFIVHLTGSSTSKLTQTDVEAIFQDADKSQLAATLKDIQRSAEAFKALDDFLTETVGSTRWSGEPLKDTLARAEQVLLPRAHHPMKVVESEALDKTESTTATATADCTSKTNIHLVVSKQTCESLAEPPDCRTNTKITSRSEATLAIDSICSYFETNEPASPVPLLLQRAKRLIPMSFVEILRELAPNEGQQLLQSLVFAEKIER